MTDISTALKRKLGPLPAWAWALIGGVGLYWYRNRSGSSVAGGTTASTVTGQIADQTQSGGQAPIPLGPGESVYDPNTGQLVSAPGSADSGLGAGLGGDGGGLAPAPTPDPTQAIEDLASAIANMQQQAPVVNIVTPKQAAPRKVVKPRGKAKHKAVAHKRVMHRPTRPHGHPVIRHRARPKPARVHPHPAVHHRAPVRRVKARPHPKPRVRPRKHR